MQSKEVVMQSKPSLDTLKKLFYEGLQYSQNLTGYYYPPEKELGLVQKQRVLNAKTYQEFASAVQIYNYSREFGFPGPPDIETGDILRYSNFQFGKCIRGIYSMSGNDGTTGFAYTLSRNEIAPPAVVRSFGLEPEECVIWLFGGGYGSRGIWHSFPFEWLENTHYERWSETTFYFDGTGPDRIEHVQFSSSEPMRFDLDILYKGNSGNMRHLRATLFSRGPPLLGNLGNNQVSGTHHRLTSYLYPSMSLELVADTDVPKSGKGFIQHTEQIPPPNGFIAQTKIVAVLKPNIFKHVLYLLVQFTNYQYYLGIYINKPIQVGSTLDQPFSIIKYSFGIREEVLVPHIDIVVNKVVKKNNVAFPTHFLISVGKDSITIKSPYGEGLAINAWFQGNFEQPCDVTDSEFNKGIGLIRYNNTFDAKTWADIAFGPGHPREAKLMTNQPYILTSKRLLAHFLIILFWTLVALIILWVVGTAFFLSFRTSPSRGQK